MSASVPAGKPRTRFAPSPTGALHIGGVRTALFCWLYSRQAGGQFLMRIEDTDLERSEQRFTDDIFASMKWLGLDHDEEPLHQSQRIPLYLAKAEELIAAGHAYRCTCTEDEIGKMRELALKLGKKPQYDRRCRELKLGKDVGKPFVIRLKIPESGHIEFEDLVRGTIRVNNSEVDDFVLIRSSGATTYNLSCVIDDMESGITHVIRGDDHINNTPKQLHIARYLGFATPIFAHLPMILGADKKKLSKRDQTIITNVSRYRSEGYLPEALLNFLARLGWSHGDQEEFTLEELVKFFGFDHVQKAGAVFNPEKLMWLNAQHMRKAAPGRLRDIALEDFAECFSEAARKRAGTKLGVELCALIQPKVKLVKELAEQLAPLCEPGAVAVDASGLKWGKDGTQKDAILGAVRQVRDLVAGKLGAQGSECLRDVGMGHAEIEAAFRQICDASHVKLGELAGPLRLAVTGRMISAGLFDVLAILPGDVARARLELAAKF